MSISSRALATASLFAALLVLPASARAQNGVVARVLTPVSRDAVPGSTVRVVWTLTVAEAGKRRPYGPGYVFVRLFGPAGSRTPPAYGVHAVQPGRYRARVRIPRGGVTRLVIGVVGSECDDRGCRRALKYFRIAGPSLR